MNALHAEILAIQPVRLRKRESASEPIQNTDATPATSALADDHHFVQDIKQLIADANVVIADNSALRVDGTTIYLPHFPLQAAEKKQLWQLLNA